jgi:copper transport protein
MMTIATSYLPVLRVHALRERAYALVTVLPYYTPWAAAGVLIMAVTGPFSATVHLSSWAQLFLTAYGRVLVVKVLLVGALLLTSALHVFFLRPRLRKEEQKYALAVARHSSQERETISTPPVAGIARQVKLRERRLAAQTHRLTTILRYEPLLGVAVLLCVGLMNVFAGTLVPAAPAAPAQHTPVSSFQTTATTADQRFTVTLIVAPNQPGPNSFTVSVRDARTGKATTNVGVSLYTSHLDMEMGTDTVNLQPDGKGHFSATGDLVMGGHWQIRIQIRTPQNTLHEARVTFVTPF